MGNRSSTPQPAQPPALLAAAVKGDLDSFVSEWATSGASQTDRQSNNVLHALFSCRSPNAKMKELLDKIHADLSDEDLTALYSAKNDLGCTPLWILVAYGDVDLLKAVQGTEWAGNSSSRIIEWLSTPNNQGDSPFLATSSQGNLDMIQYLQQQAEFDFAQALSQANSKGTTPLQIIVGNGHSELLRFVLEHLEKTDDPSTNPILEKNAAGLSLFHICSERNFSDGLQLLLDQVAGGDTLKRVFDVLDKNEANALHVACYCGNLEVVQVWLNVINKSNLDDDTTSSLLDRLDGQGRTAYWLAMVQGHSTIGELLEKTGAIDTQRTDTKMLEEIAQANQRRQDAASRRLEKQR